MIPRSKILSGRGESEPTGPERPNPGLTPQGRLISPVVCLFARPWLVLQAALMRSSWGCVLRGICSNHSRLQRRVVSCASEINVPADQIVAALVAISFAAGLNVYATIASLGIMERVGVLALPPALHLLGDSWVIGASLALFLIEFFADKIPILDLAWNALHTFVRVPVAVLLAYGVTSNLSPGMNFLCAALGGLIAFIAHGGKTAARAAVSASPEPFSNIGLSLGEDGVAIGLSWLATAHPYIAAAIALSGVAAAFFLIHLVSRSVKTFVHDLFRS